MIYLFLFLVNLYKFSILSSQLFNYDYVNHNHKTIFGKVIKVSFPYHIEEENYKSITSQYRTMYYPLIKIDLPQIN
jgi:hypothetical protein